jgi:hypothetical protein
MEEGVEKTYHMGVIARATPPLLIRALELYPLQDLYLIEGSIHVPWGALLDFDCDVGCKLEIAAEPDGGEVSPS